MPIVNFQHRLIAFFDILGFSDRLEKIATDELHAEYAALIDEASTAIFEQTAVKGSPNPHVSNFEKIQFVHDSIILLSYPASDVKNICKFIFSCILLMEKSFARGFFLRGCITLGDVLFDSDRNILLSARFPALLHAEKQQEWSGCYVDSAAKDAVLDGVFGPIIDAKFRSTRNMPLVEYTVPKKEGGRTKHWCLNWIAMLDDPLFRTKSPMLNDAKREGTRAFAEYVYSLPDDSQLLPEDAKPAVMLTAMKSRGSLRTKFIDHTGCGVVPGWKTWTIAVFEPPEVQ